VFLNSNDASAMKVAFSDVADGEEIVNKTMLSGFGTNPFRLRRHTLWVSIPGGYWEYKNPWTRKAFNMIVAIQNEYDEGKQVSYLPDWKRCSECGKWTTSFQASCNECYYD